MQRYKASSHAYLEFWIFSFKLKAFEPRQYAKYDKRKTTQRLKLKNKIIFCGVTWAVNPEPKKFRW